MKPKKIEIVKFSDDIYLEIKEKFVDSSYVLKEYSKNNFNVYKKYSFITFQPDLGPVVTSKLSFNRNHSGKMELNVERINGRTYKYQLGFAGIFTFILFIISIYFLFKEETDLNYVPLFMLVFGLFYILSIELIADYKFSESVKHVKTILKDKKIEFRELK